MFAARQVQGGAGKFPAGPSPPTNRAVAAFLRDRAELPPEAVRVVEGRGVEEVVQRMTKLQVCKA